MLKLLSKKGFTLIELLVVITIIAVLAVIAFAAFRGFAGRANDSRISADLKAIADAYEVKRGQAASYGGLALTNDDFSGGIIPVNPIPGRNYCFRSGTGAIPVANAAPTDFLATGACNGTTWTAVGTGALPANTTFFKVCALDNAAAVVRCVGSRQ